MAITVEINLGYEFDVKAKASDVFAVLSDVPTSASHFPKVDQLVDLGGGAYRWEMEKSVLPPSRCKRCTPPNTPPTRPKVL